ncbi:hypothetical protein LAJ19_09580 [Deinococcus taeanensis]|uniref:hypothetical protein n=1 Tax=Deinococcus taeanensis TaxID=2737050 RepID=UPI001CDCA3A8|nr:hypothetical protein [Deinococcus taeanensis]UBV41893.1 hypothetical protein LAJ19_09580 [Deinococcus taeanensis]
MAVPTVILWPLVSDLPLLIVWVVGTVLAALRVRHTPALRWVVAALVLLGITRLTGGILLGWLPVWAAEQKVTATTLSPVLTAVAAGRTLLEVIGWLLLLTGVFSGRRHPPASRIRDR